MCAYILLNFSWLQSGRTGSLWLKHPAGLLGASGEKQLWFHFMAPLMLSGEVNRAAEADGRASQQVFHGDFLVVQGLRLHTPNAEGPGSIPGQGTRACMPQLRPGTAQEINKNKYFEKIKLTLFLKNIFYVQRV